MSSIRNTWVVCQREIGAYFFSPMAYVVLFLFALTNGVLFHTYCLFFANEPQQITLVIENLYGFNLFWILPLSPLLTMRLFAEEKRTGSMEMLMTAPVREVEVVLGKFFAAQVFYMFVWLSLVPLLVVLGILGSPDWGPVMAIYWGLFAIGLLTNALGVFASAGTRNQLVAAILALTGNLAFMLISMAQGFARESPDMQRVIHYLSYTAHFAADYTRGIVDLRYFVFYLTFASLFLFLTVRMLEARKWR